MTYFFFDEDFPENGFFDETFNSSEACEDDDDNSSGSTGGYPECELSATLRIAEAAIKEEEDEDSQVVQLEDGLWSSLPLELVNNILSWLPPAAHFRFRCVCKRWRSLLSFPEWLPQYAKAQPRPSCTTMCSEFSSSIWFFCHSERKWFHLPQYPINSLHLVREFIEEDEGWDLEWELIDADVGLVCYRPKCQDMPFLCVSNPLTKSSKVVPLRFPPNLDGQKNRKCKVVKLHVDRQTKSFKVVVFLRESNPPMTIMYDSKTSLWSDCGSYPCDTFNDCLSFVWKNAICYHGFEPKILFALNMESWLWSQVEIALPWHMTTKDFIVNHNDNVLLVQIQSEAEECMSVWKLQDDASDFSRSSWIEVPLGEPNVPCALKPLLKDFRTCVSQGDWIFFSLDNTNRWVKYTFATKSWQVMPYQGMKGSGTDEGIYDDMHYWFAWEPRLDVNVVSDPL